MSAPYKPNDPDGKFCKDCGEKIKTAAEICPHCGVRQMSVPENINASPKSFVAALILVVLLGGLGVHRFYVGKPVTGILIILTFFGFFGIWPLIDLILIATGNFKDSNGLKISHSGVAAASEPVLPANAEPLSEQPPRKSGNQLKVLGYAIALVVLAGLVGLLVFDAINGGLEDDGIGSSSNVNTSSQPKLTQTSTPVTPTEVPVAQYEGCDGLSDLIERVKTDGMGKLGLYSVVNVGDEDICNNTIKQMNKPELLKD